MTFVLDASAVLALIFDEPGADAVLARADGALLSTVNLFEVCAKAAKVRSIDAEALMVQLRRLSITFTPLTEHQAMIAARISDRVTGGFLSMADRCCLALAQYAEATALTADRAWATLDIGVPVELIR